MYYLRKIHQVPIFRQEYCCIFKGSDDSMKHGNILPSNTKGRMRIRKLVFSIWNVYILLASGFCKCRASLRNGQSSCYFFHLNKTDFFLLCNCVARSPFYIHLGLDAVNLITGEITRTSMSYTQSSQINGTVKENGNSNGTGTEEKENHILMLHNHTSFIKVSTNLTRWLGESI